MLNQNQLINKIKSYNSFVDAKKLKDAFFFAEQAHITQKRDSGEPYISHPVAVANILAELKLDGPTITTALLHDTIEDTGTTFIEVKKKFGNEIAELVEGVTKLSRLENKNKEFTLAENFRKLILATSKDIRVLLVKLADRLHNLRPLVAGISDEKRNIISTEKREIYERLANRIGMNTVEEELDDLFFKFLTLEART